MVKYPSPNWSISIFKIPLFFFKFRVGQVNEFNVSHNREQDILPHLSVFINFFLINFN